MLLLQQLLDQRNMLLQALLQHAALQAVALSPYDEQPCCRGFSFA
jgi:hypothetical protein